MKGIKLRKMTASDLEFLEQLYGCLRREELAVTDFSEKEKTIFIQSQFKAQHSHYTNHYNTERFFIIEKNGKAIGRYYVDYWTTEVRIVDLLIMPEYRNMGIGSYLFNQTFIEADELELSVTIHVEHTNPAKKLYERLGFKLKSKRDEIYQLMERKPI